MNLYLRTGVVLLSIVLPQVAQAQTEDNGFELAAAEADFNQPRQVTVKVDDETITIPYYNIDNMAVFEGDILLGTAEELALINLLAGTDFEELAGDEADEPMVEQLGDEISDVIAPRGLGIKRNFQGKPRRWPDNTVPYAIEPGFGHAQIVRQAITHWEDNTDIRFVERTSANASQYPNSVVFHDPGQPKCSSFVGMQGGAQVINLGVACGLGAAIHEIGHAVGLGHEHTRSDRDNYVLVDWSNIQQNATFNFETNPAKYVDLGAYDYGSIMHYSGRGFAINPAKPTITPKTPGAVIGQRRGLSAGDLAAVADMYSSQ